MAGHWTSSSRAVSSSGGQPEQGPEGTPRGGDEQHPVRAEPLIVEVHDGRARLRIVEHPPRLPLDAGPRGQLSGRGGREQLGVGHRVPEEVGEARGQLPRCRTGANAFDGGVGRLDPEVERGGLQDAGHGEGHRFVRWSRRQVRLPERLEPLALAGAQRPAPRALGEPLDAGPGATLLLDAGQGGPGVAREERRRFEGERREVHRRQV